MRRADYLFIQPGNRNWHIKLQSPTGRIERSLGTSDRVQAEILALPMIAEHYCICHWRHLVRSNACAIRRRASWVLLLSNAAFHGPEDAVLRQALG